MKLCCAASYDGIVREIRSVIYSVEYVMCWKISSAEFGSVVFMVNLA